MFSRDSLLGVCMVAFGTVLCVGPAALYGGGNLDGEDFVFGFERHGIHSVDRVVFYNEGQQDQGHSYFSKAHQNAISVQLCLHFSPETKRIVSS